ncbi:hypothetical protein BJ165DRAFT_1494882 [Panaeolus papilionaceus]|nr:hypothetical protein BJ165DRAFT_1494882 [Panaeolus papilionaceus]
MFLTTVNDIMARIPSNFGVVEEKLWSSSTTLVARQAGPSPDSDQGNNDDSPGRSTKRALEYLFISIALLVLFVLVYRSFIIRARRNRSNNVGLYHPEGNDSYGPRRPAPAFDPYNPQSYPPRWGAFPNAHLNPNGQVIRPTRAGDIDAGGRRIGDQNVELDYGQLGDKEALPAYDTNGGPPRYADVQRFAPAPVAGSNGVNTGIPGSASPPPSGQTLSGPNDPQLFPLPRR